MTVETAPLWHWIKMSLSTSHTIPALPRNLRWAVSQNE